MSRIRIRNIGPIKAGLTEGDGFVDIRKVTMFIGNQATGKSTLAKLISTLTWMEKDFLRMGFSADDKDLSRKFVDEYSAFQGLRNYFRPNSSIEFHGQYLDIDYREGVCSVSKMRGGDEPYIVPKIMYVPAERNFLSIVEHPQRLEGLPRPLFAFLDEYMGALIESTEALALPFRNLWLEVEGLTNLPYIVGEDYRLRLSESSSGLQSSAPLYLVSKKLSDHVGIPVDASKSELSFELEQRRKSGVRKILRANFGDGIYPEKEIEIHNSRFKTSSFFNIVEEMEQNLFPSSQRSLFYSLLSLANIRVEDRLLLTTHSPYLINFLTLAIKAREVIQMIGTREENANLRQEIQKIVPLSAAVADEDAAVYEFMENGSIQRLPTYHGLPSDANLLNQILGDGNRMFDALLDIEERI